MARRAAASPEPFVRCLHSHDYEELDFMSDVQGKRPTRKRNS